MIPHKVTTLRRPIAIDLLAALTIFILLASHAFALEFFGEQEPDGDLRIIDGAGAEVTVLSGNPLGTRPDICLPGSYYFNELESDKSQMVLTDCATDNGSYPVQLLTN